MNINTENMITERMAAVVRFQDTKDMDLAPAYFAVLELMTETERQHTNMILAEEFRRSLGADTNPIAIAMRRTIARVEGFLPVL